MNSRSRGSFLAPASQRRGPGRRSRLRIALTGAAAALAFLGGGAAFAADHTATSSDSSVQQTHNLAAGWKYVY
ncbi:hypothetical protein ACWC9T_32255 [Kitasatospora sp. NPDC001159]